MKGRKHEKKIVIGVDIGTTNIRCFAYDNEINVIGSAIQEVYDCYLSIPILNLDDEKQEIEPESLWNAFQNVVKGCLHCSNLNAGDVSCLGIATQRGSFVTWDRETGNTYHNFITWKDKRSRKDCKIWNSSLSMKLFRFGAHLLYLITRKNIFQVASAFKLKSTMVLMRLHWVLEHFDQIRQHSLENKALFGTIDTWLVWKLTDGQVHATDASNACVTGFFDPFKMQWAEWMLKIFDIPANILPEVKNTSDSYGHTVAQIFGESIPVSAVVGDQQASLFGTRCFNKYDTNCTMGTGSFLIINTGCTPAAARHDIYPLVGWNINSVPTYVAECGVHDTGTMISWAQNLGLFTKPHESSTIANSTSDGSVYFLPAQSWDSGFGSRDSSAFLGLKVQSSKAHLVKAILEALAFQVVNLYETVSKHVLSSDEIKVFKISGGVGRNDFIAQLIADLTSCPVTRLNLAETASLGAAFFAGLHNGVWKNEAEILALKIDSQIFFPSCVTSNKLEKFLKWKKISSCSNSQNRWQ